MGVINSKIVKFSFLIVSGILFAYYFTLSLKNSFLFLVFSIVCFFTACYYSKKIWFQTTIFGWATFLVFFAIGTVLLPIHNPENQPRFYANSQADFLKVVLQEQLKNTNYQQRFIAKVVANATWKDKQLTSLNSNGKLLLYLPKKGNFEIGNSYYIPTNYRSISPPKNPHQFNYRNYLKHQEILYQQNLKQNQLFLITNTPYSITKTICFIRKKIRSFLNNLNLETSELSILQALIIGDRTAINQKLYQQYAAAGAIHILAVSGLHVGILLLFIRLLLLPLRHFKYGKRYILIGSVIGIWLFAIVTGLSASVVRAATMFSFVAFGLYLNRKSSLINSIFSSFLFLIILNPHYIFQVGFQLSYAAILSIALFMPEFEKMWNPKNKIINYYYQLITISICAQIGVLPLSLYYFHQFPGLFLLTNFVALQLLPILLIGGFFLLFFGFIGWNSSFLNSAYQFVLKLLNEIIGWIANQETFVITHLHLSKLSSILLILVFYSVFLAFQHKKVKNISFLLIAVVVFQSSLLYDKSSFYTENLYILNKNYTTVIAHKNHRKLTIYTSSEAETLNLWKYIDNVETEEGIQQTEISALKNFYEFKNLRIQLIDSSGVYKPTNFKPDLLLLSHSPRVNLKRLLQELKPKLIIADANNYYYLTKLWAKTCTQQKIPFYDTRKKGAFILSNLSTTAVLELAKK